MADLTINYKGQPIVEMSESGTKTLKTGGKYCEDDISVEYTKNGIALSAASGYLPTIYLGSAWCGFTFPTNIYSGNAVGVRYEET